MKFERLMTAALIGGASAAENIVEGKSQNLEANEDARQYLPTKNSNYFNYYDRSDDLNYLHPESNFIDGFTNDQIAQESNVLPISSHSSGLSSGSTPALSALALLGFLYFLNLIQNVLQGTSGKKKRQATDELTSTLENVDSYLKSVENFVDIISDYVPVDQELRSKEGRSLLSERSLEERAGRVISFFSSLWDKTRSALGLVRRHDVSRNDYDVESRPTQADGGFWSMFGNKVGLVATLMDFLDDPSPTRIGRSIRVRERDDDNAEDGEELAEPKELNEEEKKLLPEEVLSRKKRFTDGMNSWYKNRQMEPSTFSQGPSPIYGMLFNFLKGAFTVPT